MSKVMLSKDFSWLLEMLGVDPDQTSWFQLTVSASEAVRIETRQFASHEVAGADVRDTYLLLMAEFFADQANDRIIWMEPKK